MSNIGYSYLISNNEYYIITIKNLYPNHEPTYEDVNDDCDGSYNHNDIIKEYAEYTTDEYKIIDIQDEDGQILNLRFPLPKQINYYLSKDIVLNIINYDIFFEKKNILDKTFSGIQKSYYKNGVLQSEFFHCNGKIEGEYKTYYNNKLSITNPQNKIIHEICNYINGKIEGEYIKYYESGQISKIYGYPLFGQENK